jgi:hypothetical protein
MKTAPRLKVKPPVIDEPLGSRIVRDYYRKWGYPDDAITTHFASVTRGAAPPLGHEWTDRYLAGLRRDEQTRPARVEPPVVVKTPKRGAKPAPVSLFDF